MMKTVVYWRRTCISILLLKNLRRASTIRWSLPPLAWSPSASPPCLVSLCWKHILSRLLSPHTMWAWFRRRVLVLGLAAHKECKFVAAARYQFTCYPVFTKKRLDYNLWHAKLNHATSCLDLKGTPCYLINVSCKNYWVLSLHPLTEYVL